MSSKSAVVATRSAPASTTTSPFADRGRERGRAPPFARRASRVLPAASSTMASACGNRWVRPPSGVASGVPCEATSRAASVRGCKRDLLPEHGSRRELEAIDGARQPQAPASSRRGRPRIAIGAELLGDGLRVGIEVEHSPAPLHGRGEIAEIVEPEHGANVVGLRGQLGHARTVGQAQRAPVGRAHHLFDAGHCARRGTLTTAPPSNGARHGSRRTMTPGGARSRPLRAVRMSLGVDREDLSDRVVELADAREAGSECHARERQLGRLDQHARSEALRTREARSAPHRPPQSAGG